MNQSVNIFPTLAKRKRPINTYVRLLNLSLLQQKIVSSPTCHLYPLHTIFLQFSVWNACLCLKQSLKFHNDDTKDAQKDQLTNRTQVQTFLGKTEMQISINSLCYCDCHHNFIPA